MSEELEQPSAFADVLRGAIERSRLSLTQIHNRLREHGNPVSMATLSYWRSGERRPEGAASLSAVDDLERILGMPAGALTDRIVQPLRMGPLNAPRVPFDEERERRETEETFAALGAAPQVSIRDLSTHMTVTVGADGAIDRTVYRCIVQVTEGVVAELPLIDIDEEATDATLQIVDVVGGRLDREYRHPGGRLSGIVIAFDEPAAAGETVLFEFAEVYPPGYPRRRTAWHATARASKETVISVHFPPGGEPDWCEEYVEVDGDETTRPAAMRGLVAHAMRHGFGPGVLGLRWGRLD
ncbi:hypothetical protein FVO59_02935 [Microbacterium esteraromaticum]|uniref:Uncharacterized protein n=1 Tax=Microbacterium esteraromaticum TaxID=57043 RepID=A0A7D7W7B3_9MICO|nr:hypothetical protein [Microbacterium esteraromaticum]QMU96278.1 hypothetical protein FVO59_02935 [Microbacterium esteraromaticum]